MNSLPFAANKSFFIEDQLSVHFSKSAKRKLGE